MDDYSINAKITAALKQYKPLPQYKTQAYKL